MRRGPLVVAVVVLALIGALGSTAVLARQGGRGGLGPVVSGGRGGLGPVVGGGRSFGFHQGFRHQHHHGFHNRHSKFHHRRGFPSSFPWGVATVYAPPLYYGGFGYGAFGYSAPPAYSPSVYTSAAMYAPPAAYAAPDGYGPAPGESVPVAPSPPPTPSVVPYPHGRYELRGDGIATPYTWVWIPNPPPPPPAPSGVNPEEQPISKKPAPPVDRKQLYRWTDEQGVMHFTDRLEAVPPAVRAFAHQTPRS